MTGALRVNVPELRAGGLSFGDAASSLPDAPTQFASEGTDALSTALTRRTNEIEAPLAEQLPAAKTDARGTAANIGVAADRYEQTDQDAQANVNAKLAEFDSTFGSPSSAGGGGMDAMSQFGQMIQMPMQMAQQLGQVPMQMAQQLGQIPQAVMQGVQQIGQMGGGLGQSGDSASAAEGVQAESENDDEREAQESQTDQSDGAAATESGTQSAPVAPPSSAGVPEGSPSESTPQAASPAPSRTPTDPSIVL